MKLKKNIATSEAGLIFNPGTGDSFSVNETGREILSVLKEDKTQDELVVQVTGKYDVEITQLEKDIEDFLTMLHEYNLVDD
ncbi:MAG: PqqD family protein [Chloroflexota bacterium]